MNRTFAGFLAGLMLLSAIAVSAQVPQADRDTLIALYNTPPSRG